MRKLPKRHQPWLKELGLGFLIVIAYLGVVQAQSPSTTTKASDTKAAKAPESTTTPVPRPGSWATLHQSFVDRAKKGDVDLLFLGDSITRGWAGKDKNGEGPREIWSRHYGPRRAANFGIGGDRTQHVLWRIENGELEGISPRAVVLMIGTNNAHANTADEIAEGIETIVQSLRCKLPDSKILLLAVFPRGEKPNPHREKLATVNQRIAKLDDGKVVKFLDIGKHFLNADGTISPDVMPDFLHLSRKGYQMWADAMEPTLWSLLDEATINKKP